MTARDKLLEVNYFIQNVRDSKSNIYAITYNFSACLNAANSMPDFVLDEAINHFKMNISEDAASVRKAFAKVVKELNSFELNNFYTEWLRATKKFQNNRIFKYRHINIHRRPVYIALGIGAHFNSSNPEKTLIEQYNKFLLNNDGWFIENLSDARKSVKIATIDEALSRDPHLEIITNDFIQSLKEKNQRTDDISIVFSTTYLGGELILEEPICIIGLKLIIVCEQYITSFYEKYPWIAQV